MVSFENFVKSLPPSLSELKVKPIFCFPIKIRDDRTASNDYVLSTVVTKSKLEALVFIAHWSDLVKFLTIRCVRYCFLASKFEKN